MSIRCNVHMDDDVKHMLDSFAQRSKTAQDDIVNKAVRHYIHLQEIKDIRNELKHYTNVQGFLSEDEIFDSL